VDVTNIHLRLSTMNFITVPFDNAGESAKVSSGGEFVAMRGGRKCKE
jgi:hypothetical protein